MIFAPEAVLDYIVIHELAHRKEMNHSPAFYKIVYEIMPDYKAQQKWLRETDRSSGTESLPVFIIFFQAFSISQIARPTPSSSLVYLVIYFESFFRLSEPFFIA